MCVFEYKEKRARLLVQIMNAVEAEDMLLEVQLRTEMNNLDRMFKKSRQVAA